MFRRAGSLIPRVSLTGVDAARPLSQVSDLPPFNPEITTGGATEDKLLRELNHAMHGNGTSTWPSGGNHDEVAESGAVPAVRGSTHSIYGIEGHGDIRRETDGGVRLAGGMVREVLARSDDFDREQDSISGSEGSTLPPPYSSQFGEMWCVWFMDLVIFMF